MTQPMPLIVLEVFLGFGVPLVWAIYELLQLRRYREQDRRACEAEAESGKRPIAPDP